MPYPVIYLAQSRTTDGTLTAVKYEGTLETADVYFAGTFNGASVMLQSSPVNDGSAAGYVNIMDEAITANIVKRMQIGQDTNLRAVISSAGASTSLTIFVRYYKD
jgi:hypothetical protein